MWGNLEESVDDITAMQYVAVMQQDRVVALDAVQGPRYKLPLADSIIYATAQQARAVVWNKDGDFENLDGVRYWRVRGT